jgi:hypothetical protein
MTDKSLRRPYPPKIVTANALMEGDAVYFTKSRTWSREIGEAHAVHNADEADRLLAEANTQAGKIVGAYLADVSLESGQPAPIHFREEFRTRGPSNYFHGKQVEQV